MASADDSTVSALVVVCSGDRVDVTVRKVVQGVNAQERIVRALVVPVLVLGGFDRAASEHSLSGGHMETVVVAVTVTAPDVTTRTISEFVWLAQATSSVMALADCH